MANEQGTSRQAWLIFLAVIAIVCVCYPPILGFVFGLIVWILPVAAIVYLLFGHDGRVM